MPGTKTSPYLFALAYILTDNRFTLFWRRLSSPNYTPYNDLTSILNTDTVNGLISSGICALPNQKTAGNRTINTNVVIGFSGIVQLGNLDDSLHNIGIWNKAGGANAFGTRTNTVINNGVILDGGNAGAAVTTSFNELTTFTNNAGGVLSMDNDLAGDFTILSGDYIGNGGGKISTDDYGFGSTLTWFGENGLYADRQAQVTWYNSDLSYDGCSNHWKISISMKKQAKYPQFT